MKLSRNFTEEEFLSSQMATRHAIQEQFKPSEEIIENLHITAAELQKIRDKWGNPLHISSGYRCPMLNSLVGGAKNSAHVQGLAADIDLGSKEENQKFMEFAKQNFKFDQLINEYNYAWVHIGYKANESEYRNQVLTIK